MREQGYRNSTEYKAWHNMIQRCENPDNPGFERYGGRGIKVCRRWYVFEDFLLDVGKKPSPELTLDRKDNNGDYEPGNVHWATWSQQNNNRRQRTCRTCESVGHDSRTCPFRL